MMVVANMKCVLAVVGLQSVGGVLLASDYTTPNSNTTEHNNMAQSQSDRTDELSQAMLGNALLMADLDAVKAATKGK